MPPESVTGSFNLGIERLLISSRLPGGNGYQGSGFNLGIERLLISSAYKAIQKIDDILVSISESRCF